MKQYLFKLVLFLGIMIALDLTTGMVMDHIMRIRLKGIMVETTISQQAHAQIA